MGLLKSNIIVNADDFGLSDAVNQAIESCFRNGLVNQTSIMVNMPFYKDAVLKSKKGNFFDRVGLHLNLTEGIPLTDSIKKTKLCTDGLFNQSIIRNKIKRFVLKNDEIKAVREECVAQIESYLREDFPFLHLDSHQHIHTNYSIFKILCPLIKTYGFKSIRLSRVIPDSGFSFLKQLYKKFFNDKIKDINFGNESVYKSLKWFGSIDDLIVSKDKIDNDLFELMVHPVMINGRIYDSVTHKDLFECLMEG